MLKLSLLVEGGTCRDEGAGLVVSSTADRSSLFGVQLLSVRMPNAAGRGERISSDFIYGSKNAVGWSLNFIKPVLGYVQLPYVLLSLCFFVRKIQAIAVILL